MKLKALKTYDFNGAVLKPGDEFETSDHSAKQLIALKQAVSLEPEKSSEFNEGFDLNIYVAKSEYDALETEFNFLKNSQEALKARLAKLNLGDDQQLDQDDQAQEYSKLNNDQLKVILAEKGIEFKQSAKKDELIALIVKE